MNELQKIDGEIIKIIASINDPNLCEDTADTYTRCTGYYRPVRMFNNGKQSEYMQRLEFELK
jgi:anaerobic ribonucleoside-triphosphate reductase